MSMAMIYQRLRTMFIMFFDKNLNLLFFKIFIIVFNRLKFVFLFFQADITCSSTKQSVGVIFTRTNFVTLKYVTDSWGTRVNGFRLIITAFKDPCK